MLCTFFCHRDAPTTVESELERVLTELIERQGVDQFLVGHQGVFDNMVVQVLSRLKHQYQNIQFAVVYAYMPVKEKSIDLFETIYPEALDGVHPRFAIDRRNRWLVEQADVVVVYVKSPSGGAAKFKAFAEKKGKVVINLAETIHNNTI